MEHCRLEQITFLTDQTQLNHIGAFKTAASLSSLVAKSLDPTSTLSFHLLNPDPAGRANPCPKLMDLGRSHLHYKDLPKLFQIFRKSPCPAQKLDGSGQSPLAGNCSKTFDEIP